MGSQDNPAGQGKAGHLPAHCPTLGRGHWGGPETRQLSSDQRGRGWSHGQGFWGSEYRRQMQTAMLADRQTHANTPSRPLRGSERAPGKGRHSHTVLERPHSHRHRLTLSPIQRSAGNRSQPTRTGQNQKACGEARRRRS